MDRKLALLGWDGTTSTGGSQVRPGDGGRRLVEYRDAAIVALAEGAGLTSGQISRVRVEDIDWPARAVRVGRGRREEVVEVEEVTMRHLVAWRDASRIDSGPLFRPLLKGSRGHGPPLDRGLSVSRVYQIIATATSRRAS